MKCRVCGSGEVRTIGDVEYYPGFAWPVFDCLTCSCRFTQHDQSIYNRLHASSSSVYALYRKLAESCKRLFDLGDLAGLRRELSVASKYKFIIDEVERQGKSVRILEIGCSRGYLTSYFILARYRILGADVSPDAVAAAREAFGDHFVCADAAEVAHGAPYDIIYHVGTIGCVGDPLGLTRNLLEMLRPGGQLLFNAPNGDACWRRGQLWLDAAPPPDVVTLFRSGFWREKLSDVARVEETVELYPSDQAFGTGISKLMGRSWQRPVPLSLNGSAAHYQNGRSVDSGWRDRVWNAVERGSSRLGRLTRLSRLAPSQPSPFGLFVKLTKN